MGVDKWGVLTIASLAAALASPAACGSKTQGTLAQDDAGGGDDGPSSSSAGSSSGSSGSSGSGPTGQFQPGKNNGMGTGACQTGMYTGAFSCGFIADPDASAASVPDASSDGGGGFTIQGNLSFVLSQSMSGELGHDTASGTFVVNTGLTTGMAMLTGTLDCSTGMFTGQLSGGMYSFLGIFTGPFEGPLTSEYNGTSFSFVNGVWSLAVPGQGYCPGSWSAHYVDQ